MSDRTHAICEVCWIKREVDADGMIRMPIRIKDPMIETCCFCAATTIFGVFVRADPAEPWACSKFRETRYRSMDGRVLLFPVHLPEENDAEQELAAPADVGQGSAAPR